MPEYCGEVTSHSAALSYLCSKENELPASLYSSLIFFCTTLPRSVAEEAELPYLPLNWHGVIPVFSVHSNIGLTCWHEALSACWHLLWGDCLSAVPKLWNDSWWWRFTTWDVFPSVCSWAFLLGGCEWICVRVNWCEGWTERFYILTWTGASCQHWKTSSSHAP